MSEADLTKRIYVLEQKFEKMDKGMGDFARTVGEGMLEMRAIIETLAARLPDEPKSGLILPPSTAHG